MINLKDFTGHDVTVHYTELAIFLWDNENKHVVREFNGEHINCSPKVVQIYRIKDTDELFILLSENEGKHIVFLRHTNDSIYYKSDSNIMSKNTKLFDQRYEEFIKCNKDPIYWYNTYTAAGKKNPLNDKDYVYASTKWYEHLYAHRIYNVCGFAMAGHLITKR